MSRRVVAWYSHGAASAVATKIALARHGSETVIACIDTGAEHACRLRAVGLEHGDFVIYVDTWDVWERERYLVGPTGARCTAELKKKVRHAFERPDDLQVFGYTADPRDAKRAERFTEQNPGVDMWAPLVEAGLSKGDCLALVERAGIALPAMYLLGYSNNNCVGCVKGGMGYWNKVRVDFPATFDRMAAQERSLDHTVLRDNGEPLFLDELAPDRGRYEAETPSDCSLDCQVVENEYVAVSITRPAA